jgi:hypothetical protein
MGDEGEKSRTNLSPEKMALPKLSLRQIIAAKHAGESSGLRVLAQAPPLKISQQERERGREEGESEGKGSSKEQVDDQRSLLSLSSGARPSPETRNY